MKLARAIPFISLSFLAAAAVAAPPQTTRTPDPERRIRVEEVLRFDGDWLTHLRRNFLGVQIVSITPELREHYGATRDVGILVAGVSEDSPAARAGIRVGDIITEVGGHKVTSHAEVVRAIADHEAGDQVPVRIIRHGAPVSVTATIEERDRRVVAINRLPGNARVLQGETAEQLREFFAGDQWRDRVFRLQDCVESQERLRDLENRLQELERRLK